MVQVADAGGTRPVNPAAATISAAANAPAPQAAAAPEPATQPRMASDSFEGVPETVKIKSGDTMGKLVAKYQISYDMLKELNPEIFKDGPDSKGRKRSADGHWIYPGDVIRLRTAAAPTPKPEPTSSTPASSTPTATATATSANGRVVEAAKGAIDEAAIVPPSTPNGRQLSEQALSQAQDMLRLIPGSDPARLQYVGKVDKLKEAFQATYPSVDARGRFEESSDRFNEAVKTYYDAAELPTAERKSAQNASRDLAIRYFSEAYDASRDLSSDDRVEARERLEMMEFALTDMGVNASALALGRGEGTVSATDSAPDVAKDPSFAERDLNQDGYLSGSELDETARAFDADGNQRVTREEWEMGQMAAREVEWKREFAQADTNQDGWLSGNEAAAFRAYDADGDLEITEEEYLNAKRAEVLSGVYEQDFAARDQNQDGYLSGNELDSAMRAFDSDMDGRVSREEYMAAKAGATPMAAATAMPQPTSPSSPIEAFELASARFNDAATRNDLLTMTTTYQDAAYAIAYMPQGPDREMLAAQLEVMGFTLQQAYTATGTPVAAGGGVPGLTAQPLTAGVQPLADVSAPMAYPPGTVTPQGVVMPPGVPAQPGYVPTGFAPVAYPGQPTAAAAYPGYPVQPGYPAPAYPAQAPYAAAAAPQPANAAPAEPPRQTYTQVWSSPDALAEAMGYNQSAPPTPPGPGNHSAQGTTTPGSDAAQGAQTPNQPQVNEQAVREIDAFLQRADANAVRDMLASRPELLYDSLPRQKGVMLRLLVEGRTDAGDRAAIVNILDMAAKTEQVDYTLHELDSLYGGAGKGIKRMFEDLDKNAKAAALKAMFTPSLMQNRTYDQAAFDAVVGAMTKDDIKLLMEGMGYGVSSPWMSVFSPQARQMMISKLKSGFSLFGGGAEKQMISALEQAAVAYAPQVQLPAQQ